MTTPAHQHIQHIHDPHADPAPTGDFDVSGGQRYSDQLEREWQHLRFHRRALRTATSWGLLPHRVTDLDHLLIASGARCRRLRAEHRMAAPDERTSQRLLLHLVGIAAHDELAGRVVLQRILPVLLTQTRIRAGRGHATGQLEDLVGAAWIVIRTFDPTRQPSCLAAALARSAEHVAYKAAERRRSFSEVAIDTSLLPLAHQPAPSSGLEELATLLHDVRADPDDRAFITDLLRAESTEVLAERCGVTSRTIRNRRQAVVTRIRGAMSAA